MAPPKGKQPTKGAKQIVEENIATLSFYRNMALGASLFYGTASMFFIEPLTFWFIFLNIATLALYVACYQMMKYVSSPTYSQQNSQLLDSGLDLNMEGGMGEHVKDIVILTSITHVLAALSNYFWLMLLLLPLRAIWLLWINILGPWFFQEGPEDLEQDEKKKKKMERKLKRFQQ